MCEGNIERERERNGMNLLAHLMHFTSATLGGGLDRSR